MSTSTDTNAKKKRKRNYTWVWLLAIALVGAGAAYYFKATKKPELTKVQLATAEKRTIFARVVESGTIKPTIEVPIAPDVSGEIVELYVREGQYVKKGDLLATIRPDNYKSALEQSEAAVNIAQADYMQAQASVAQSRVSLAQDSASLERVKRLHSEKLVSEVELENAKLKYNITRSQIEAASYTIEAARYRVESSKASLKQAQQNLSRTNIYATMNGTITKLNVEKGQRVVGTVQMAGTELLKIADLSSMEVVVEINENDIVNIELGDSSKIEIDALPNKYFNGKVTDIAYSATKNALGTSDQVTNFQVKVRINPSSYTEIAESSQELNLSGKNPFRPGMSAQIEVYTDKVEEVVAVPIQAITLHRPKTEKKTDEKGGKPNNDDMKPKEEEKTTKVVEEKKQEVVFVYKDGEVKELNVKTGIADDEFIEVKDGLQSGMKVVIGPYTTLTKVLEDAMKVEEEKVEK
ncbi:MAG: efflux RND transporter periplasmic adaptor subunit [Bacteroidia bacterium]